MKVTEHIRVQSQRSRARSLGAVATLTLEQWEQTLNDFNGLCAYCLVRPFDVLEHFQPVAIAGTTVKNCIPACKGCNQKKQSHAIERLSEKFGVETIERIQQYLIARIAETPDHQSERARISSPKSKPIRSTSLSTQKREKRSLGGQEYFSVDEAAQMIGWNRATVFEWVKTLGMEKHKFLRNKRTYLKASDVARLKEIKEKPWTAGEKPAQREESDSKPDLPLAS